MNLRVIAVGAEEGCSLLIVGLLGKFEAIVGGGALRYPEQIDQETGRCSSDEVRNTSKLHHSIMLAIAYAIVCGFFHTAITAVYHMIL